MSPDIYPQRGEVWWLAFEPSVGGEIQKTRPAVIVSNNESNRYLNRVQVVPLSRKTHKLYPAECIVQLGKASSKAIASQLTTAAKERLKTKIGSISAIELQAIESAIKIQLQL